MKNKYRISAIALLGFAVLSAWLVFSPEGTNGSSWKETITLSVPQIDESGTMLTLTVGLKSGVKEGKEAQEAIGEAMDVLSALNAERKIIKLFPGSYEINKPLIFREKHVGIEFVGRINAVDALTDKPWIKNHFEDRLAEASRLMPLVKGNNVSSFIVVDGVVSDKHLQTSISGFIFQNMMAGMGGSHFPDFSYRIRQADFIEKGGSYSKYAYSDGGVASVLGNASIVLQQNVFINPSAYQCGGVLRNEQYGTSKIQASVVKDNIVVNPFAWHTGTFIDNTGGSYALIINNLIILDEVKHHQVELIMNFNKGFLLVENNRIVDSRPASIHASPINLATLHANPRHPVERHDLLANPVSYEKDSGLRRNDNLGVMHSPIDMIVRNIGWDGGAIVTNNKIEGNRYFFDLFVSSEIPKFHSGRAKHFLFGEGSLRLRKIIGRLIGRDIVLPGGWPKEMDHLVEGKKITPSAAELSIEKLRAIFSYKVNALGGKGPYFSNPQVDLAGRWNRSLAETHDQKGPLLPYQ
jgi:hypothetical protein